MWGKKSAEVISFKECLCVLHSERAYQVETFSKSHEMTQLKKKTERIFCLSLLFSVGFSLTMKDKVYTNIKT